MASYDSFLQHPKQKSKLEFFIMEEGNQVFLFPTVVAILIVLNIYISYIDISIFFSWIIIYAHIILTT